MIRLAGAHERTATQRYTRRIGPQEPALWEELFQVPIDTGCGG